MRRFHSALALSTALALFSGAASAQTKIGAIFDLTGGLNIYGIQQDNALKLAVEDVNAKGGVLGSPVEVVSYDAQSELSKYTQYANTAILKDQVKALFAGLTSSSREAMRPIVRKAKIPYFYGSLYEGGACDKETFVTGSSASQQLSVLIEWAVKKYGKKIYIMAPDYNFGTISAHWIKEYAKKAGAEVVGEDFLALTVTDYAPTIQKIQAAKPDFVVALPVGANQTGFLEQFAAAGLKDRIGVVSTNYGSGNQQVVVSPQAGKGLIASQGYFQPVENAANADFVKLWTAKYGAEPPIVSEAVDIWNAVHLWAAAANKAGSADAQPVISALESGLTFEAPNGTVKLEPGSHHLRQNIYIAEGNDKHGFNIIETFSDVAPSYENEKCDLVANPALAEHFTPESQ
ncbi:ABC transporter substrate-binding protein [Mesorhizobium sp. VK23B]|uniref:ABC transporter substrate-binding protein n=1 Tax=Mesorhizobium dulcispinae TaxID=3072316 RepID=A0ABU4X8E5_9HYPH|nr:MULTISPECIES: ABC transporter substrate-binding protein [unclassified Mesorhizobium]MDX8464689.1 ABC transporter substrate-binding protein [Mesorhizobium sp. VK23B]MDX8471075.1 ABC transporter substrate-binding protein [Mesorhizobium sp. VK23A]